MSRPLEIQIRQLADAAFEQTEPVRLDRLAATAARPQPRPRWVLVVAAVVIVAVATGGFVFFAGSTERSDTAVSVDDTALDNGVATTVEPLGPVPDFSDEFSARSMLAEIPIADFDTESIRIEGMDLDRVAALAGTTRNDSATWLPLFIDQEVSAATGLWLLHGLAQPDELANEFGISFTDVQRYLSADQFLGSSTPEPLSLPLDVFKVAQLPEELTSAASDDGIVNVGAGEDGERQIDARTAVRLLGRPLRLGIDQQRSMVSVSLSTPYTLAWLNSATATLLDEPDLAEAAAILDRDDELYTAWIHRYDRSATRWAESDRALLEDTERPITEDFSTIAAGFSGVGDSQRTTIVYVFTDDDAAASSVEPIAALYSAETILDDDLTVGDVLSVESVVASGRTVVVRAGSKNLNQFRSLLSSPSHFTVHR